MITKGFLNNKNTTDFTKSNSAGPGNLGGSDASHGDDVTRSLDDKIRDIERKIVEGKLVFVDDDGVPLPRNDGFPDISTATNVDVNANDTVNEPQVMKM